MLQQTVSNWSGILFQPLNTPIKTNKDGRYLVSVVGLLPIFLTISTISWPCASFLDEIVPLKRLTAGTSARSTRWQWYGIFWYLILVIWLLWFGQSWFWVVYVMRCCPIFLDFLLVLTITLTHFSLIPVMGDIAVDMSQGHRICVRVFCLLYSV